MSGKAKFLLVLALIVAMYVGFDAYYKPYVRKAEKYDELRADYDDLLNRDNYESKYEDLKSDYDRLTDDLLEIVRWHDIPDSLLPYLHEDDEYDYLVLEIHEICTELRRLAYR